MALGDVISAVEALLPGVTSDFGEDRLSVENAPPRIVWVPTPDTYDYRQRRGLSSTSEARSVKTRAAGCEVHVWGAGAPSSGDKYKDLIATELLLDKVILAIHQVTWGCYHLQGGQWKDARPGVLGRGYVLRVSFDFPVAAQPADDTNQAVTLTQLDQEGTAVLPSGDVTGDPAP